SGTRHSRGARLQARSGPQSASAIMIAEDRQNPTTISQPQISNFTRILKEKTRGKRAALERKRS
ncbi:MAG TPA: hypothetical protein VFE62_05575, partial [Gemmataceae bacterium]|nr:hypothetical protein [Gemmataceae bacterium]